MFENPKQIKSTLPHYTLKMLPVAKNKGLYNYLGVYDLFIEKVNKYCACNETPGRV